MHQSLKLSAQFIKCLYCSFWEQLKDVPANIKSSPELVFRRRKCDGGGYTVPQ